jgi:hypothetical protein
MKVLVIAACLVNMNDDKGGQHADVGEIVDIPKQQAESLARADRVLYCNRKDDPTKTAQFTATEAMLKAAEELSKPTAPAKDPK